MLMLLALLIQSAGDPPTGPVVGTARCQGGTDANGEIIVCGRIDPEQFRLRPLRDPYHPNHGPGLGFRIGDVDGNAYVEEEKTPDGKPDKRIMVTMKKSF